MKLWIWRWLLRASWVARTYQSVLDKIEYDSSIEVMINKGKLIYLLLKCKWMIGRIREKDKVDWQVKRYYWNVLFSTYYSLIRITGICLYSPQKLYWAQWQLVTNNIYINCIRYLNAQGSKQGKNRWLEQQFEMKLFHIRQCGGKFGNNSFLKKSELLKQ